MVHVKTAKFIVLSYLTVGACDESGVTVLPEDRIFLHIPVDNHGAEWHS